MKLFTDFLLFIYFFQIFIYLHIVWNKMTLFAQWCNQNNPQQAKPCCLFLSSRVVSCNQIKVRMVWVYAMSGNIKSTNRLAYYTRATGAVRDSLWCSRAQKANFVTSVRRRSGIRKDSIPQSERCHANMQIRVYTGLTSRCGSLLQCCSYWNLWDYHPRGEKYRNIWNDQQPSMGHKLVTNYS